MMADEVKVISVHGEDVIIEYPDGHRTVAHKWVARNWLASFDAAKYAVDDSYRMQIDKYRIVSAAT